MLGKERLGRSAGLGRRGRLGELCLFRLPGLRRASTDPQMTRELGDGAVVGFLWRTMRGPSDGMLGRGAVGGRAGQRGAVGWAVQRRRACCEVRGCRRDGQRRDDVDGGRCADAGVTGYKLPCSSTQAGRVGKRSSAARAMLCCFFGARGAAGRLRMRTEAGYSSVPKALPFMRQGGRHGVGRSASTVGGSVGLYGREKTVSVNQGRKYLVKCLASCTVQAPTSCPGRAAGHMACRGAYTPIRLQLSLLARHHDISRAAPAVFGDIR
jgi:hypothetical protein